MIFLYNERSQLLTCLWILLKVPFLVQEKSNNCQSYAFLCIIVMENLQQVNLLPKNMSPQRVVTHLKCLFSAHPRQNHVTLIN